MSAEGRLARFTVRRNRVGAAVWGAVFALVNIASALGYAATFPEETQRQAFARSVEGGGGLDVLFGRAHEIATVAGFTAWRSVLTSAVLAALWGLLRGSQTLRGEEEAGRWEVLLAAPTTPARATAAALAGLGGSWLVLYGVDAALTVGVLKATGSSLPALGLAHLALAQCIPAALFMALGALASQLAATRSQASALCGAFLGLSFAIRLVADEAKGLDWLSWAAPLGWSEQTLPLTEDHVLPDLLYLAATAVAAWGAWALCQRRDLGASTFPRRDDRPAHSGLLTGPLGLELRIQRVRIASWCASLFAAGGLFGWLSRTVGDAIAELSRQGGFGRVVHAISADFGAIAFLDATTTLASVAVMLLGASQVALARQEEATGRLDHLLVRPVRRARWMGARIAVALAACLAAALSMALGAWCGARVHGVDVALPRMLEAGLNAALPSTVVVGLGFLALGLLPRAATAAAYAVAASSFLIGVVGAAINPPAWVLRLSLIQHQAPVPSAHIAWAEAAWMAALALDAALLGAMLFQRRDIVAE